MQKLRKWTRNGFGMGERSLLLGLIVLAFAYLMPIMTRPSMMFFGVFLMPWALGMMYVSAKNRDVCGGRAILVYVISYACYAASVLLNGISGVDWMYNTLGLAVGTLLPMMVSPKVERKHLGSELFVIGTVFVVCYLPLALTAVYSVYSGKVIWLPLIEWPVGIQTPGMVNDRIRVFANPNIAGRYAVLCILFSVYGMVKKRQIAARAFFVFAALVNLLVLAHTQSRTCFISLSVGAGAMAFRFVYLAMDKKKLRIAASIAVCALTVYLALTAITAVYTTGVNVASRIVSGETEQTQVVDRFENEGQFDVYSSGRGEVYPPAVEYLKDHPKVALFGAGEKNLIQLVGSEHPEILKYNHLHCSYLTVLYRGGIAALAAEAVFLCMLVAPALRMLTEKSTGENRGMFIVPVILATMIVMSLPEEMLFVSNGIGNVVFFWMVGYLLHYDRISRLDKAALEEQK